MPIPTFEEREIYKSPTIRSQVRVAIGLDYPVFVGEFADHFDGDAIDTDKWFVSQPSWGTVTVSGGTVTLGTSEEAISPPWLQSKHNLAFPFSRDTDWTFETRLRFPTVTGFGVFLRVCGRSFRDAEAILAVKASQADGIVVNVPDGFAAEHTVWSSVGGADWRRVRLAYSAQAQTYTVSVDQDDDGAYETVETVPVAGRYADTIVIGNSTAIQGNLGAWTQIEVDYVTVQGTAEQVIIPDWAAPFTYDGERFAWLPTVRSWRISIDKRNQVDAATVEVDNFGIDDAGRDVPRLYAGFHFINRRALIVGRAGDGAGRWTKWEVLFDGRCGEKEIELTEGGGVRVVVPMRDRRRAAADDVNVLAAYSDAEEAIAGVGMNKTVAEIIADLFGKAGLSSSDYDVVATPHNTPRNYNVFRQTALAAVSTLCEQAALALYQDRTNAKIKVQEWAWGDGTPDYVLSTSQELLTVRWTESAFEMTSAEALTFESTEITGFTVFWPPAREPFYGNVTFADSVVTQTSDDHDQRPVVALSWWVRNRDVASIEVTARAQFWVDHDLELGIADSRFVGIDSSEPWIVDGWEHSGEGDEVAVTRIRLISPHPDRILRRSLPS